MGRAGADASSRGAVAFIRYVWGGSRELRAMAICAEIFGGIMLWLILGSFTFRPEPEPVLLAACQPEPVEQEPLEEAPEPEDEAELLAKLLYGAALYNTPEQQEAICWCVINRVESPLYPNTISEVCRQEGQWMGWSEDNPVVVQLYEVAQKALGDWESGAPRPIPEGCLWYTWSSEVITFRTAFEAGAGCNYWTVR